MIILHAVGRIGLPLLSLMALYVGVIHVAVDPPPSDGPGRKGGGGPT